MDLVRVFAVILAGLFAIAVVMQPDRTIDKTAGVAEKVLDKIVDIFSRPEMVGGLAVFIILWFIVKMLGGVGLGGKKHD